jgi:hypothetical protein
MPSMLEQLLPDGLSGTCVIQIECTVQYSTVHIHSMAEKARQGLASVEDNIPGGRPRIHA